MERSELDLTAELWCQSLWCFRWSSWIFMVSLKRSKYDNEMNPKGHVGKSEDSNKCRKFPTNYKIFEKLTEVPTNCVKDWQYPSDKPHCNSTLVLFQTPFMFMVLWQLQCPTHFPVGFMISVKSPRQNPRFLLQSKSASLLSFTHANMLHSMKM